MAIRQDNNGEKEESVPLITLNAFIAGLALTLAFIAAQSPFI